MLEERLGTYHFIHLGFQEYLAARYLVKGGVDESVTFLEQGPILESWWRESALLIPGYYVATKKAAMGANYIRRLAGITEIKRANARSPDAQLACAEIAATAALELKDPGDTLRTELADRLKALYEREDLLTDAQPISRAPVGVALGRLGDPRPEVMSVDAMAFCLVPAGSFFMGSDDADEDAFEYEKPCEAEFNIPYHYAISQFPVTNSQFQEFMNDKGYADDRWWAVAKAHDVWKEGKVTHRVVFYEDESKQRWGQKVEEASAPADFGSPFNLPNHPVVGISWYEALAFTEWLTVRWQERGSLRTGESVQLPNEPEWEKAARGGLRVLSKPVVAKIGELFAHSIPSQEDNPRPKRRYPWDDDPDPNRANYADSGINATSAAGCFCNPKVPYGCQDMAGNVWEWTRSLWGPFRLEGTRGVTLKFPYPYNAHDGREDLYAGPEMTRVLRGGAFGSDKTRVRCASRGLHNPGDWLRHDGFRLVVSPILL